MTVRLALAALVVAVLPACSSLPGWMVIQGQSAVTDHRHFASAPVARAAEPSPLPSRPVPLRWPRGLDDAAADRWLAETGTLALIVVRRGEVIAEHYREGYGRDSLLTSFSMAKSVVSALVGIAQAEGRLSMDDPVTRWLPELRRNDPRFDRIRLVDLARMRSGIAFDEGYRSPFSEAARFYLSDDIARQVARLRLAGDPDRAHRYASGDTQLLAMALERAVGMPLPAYLQSRIWQPMGAEHDASWSLDRAGGQAKAFCCLNARPIDYVRFGLVFLNDGRWNGRPIVPSDWVRASTAAQDGLPGADDAARRNVEWRGQPRRAAFYGWQWRRLPTVDRAPDPQPSGDFFAQGLHGQVLLVSPETQTVALRLGRMNGDEDWPTWLRALVRLNP